LQKGGTFFYPLNLKDSWLDCPTEFYATVGTMSDDLLDKFLDKRRQPKLIVVAAFDRNEDGELAPTYGPSQEQSEERAVRLARKLAAEHIGVIAWSREANPAVGEYGEPTILFQAGDIPDME